MALDQWTLASGSIKDDELPAMYYKMAQGFKGTFSTFNPGNSGVPINYLVGWNSAARSSSSSSSSGGGGFYSPDGNNLQNFLSDCLGYSYLDNTNKIHRILPDSLFDWPIFYAQSASVDGKGPCSQGTDTFEITYPTAAVQVEYKPVAFAVVEDGDLSASVGRELEHYVIREFGFDSQYLTVDGQMTYCTAPKINKATPPGKITSTQELNYHWLQVPALAANPFIPPNLKAIMACIGTVNSVPFDTVAGINAPPGTVLFTSADIKMELPSLGGSQAAGSLAFGGLYYWTLSFKFSYRNNGVYSAPDPSHSANNTFPGWGGNVMLNGVAIGHNFVYRTYGNGPGTGGYSLNLPFWDLLTADGSFTLSAGPPPSVNGVTIYQQTDLNTLFTITG